MPKNILITGGAGFIGSHTVDALVGLGHRVRILDILDPQIHTSSNQIPAYLSRDVEFIQGDVRDLNTVADALDGMDAVYHFAALTGVGQSMYDIRNYTEVNSVGTATLLEAIVKKKQGIEKVILASSRAVYGEGSHRCSEHGVFYPETRSPGEMEKGNFSISCPSCRKVSESIPTTELRPLKPISIYAATKKYQEEQCAYLRDTFGIATTMLRYFNVYGSRQSLSNPYTGVISVFYSRLKSGLPVSIYERGTPIRDFVHVSDVVRANVLALDTRSPSQPLNIGSGSRLSIGHTLHALGKACGVTPEVNDDGEFRVGDIAACYADTSNAAESLGYQPMLGLEDGLREFVDWAENKRTTSQYSKTVTELEKYGLFGRADKHQ